MDVILQKNADFRKEKGTVGELSKNFSIVLGTDLKFILDL